MAEEIEAAPQPPTTPPCLEVNCKSSGKTRRFAAGTDSGFAVSLINRTLKGGIPLALHIEAVKEGEEPIAFGSNAVLADYGDGWKLQTVTESDLILEGVNNGRNVQRKPIPVSAGAHPERRRSEPIISSLYIAKVVLAFILLFVLGAIFSLALENLPTLISFIESL